MSDLIGFNWLVTNEEEEMLKSIIVASLIAVSSAVWATPTAEQPDRNVGKYLLDQGLGLQGYDPVSYYAEGGGQPLEGNPALSETYGGVTYHFATAANRDLFRKNPTKYEPTYGGWCAWGMANGAYIEINPEIYTLKGNRLHLFIARGAKFRFDAALNKGVFKDGKPIEQNADEFWKSESGEEPRL